MALDRVALVPPPEPPPELGPWLSGPIDDPDAEPAVRQSIPVGRLDTDPASDPSGTGTAVLAEHPEVGGRYAAWLADWHRWAEAEVADRAARAAHEELFDVYLQAPGRPEDFELVLGVGCLGWRPAGHPDVLRHLLTCPARIEFDDGSGRLTVAAAQDRHGFRVELDMLEPGLVADPHSITAVKQAALDFAGHPLDRDEAGQLVRRLVHTLDAGGRFLDHDQAPARRADATASFAPALILRKRSQQALGDVLRTIAEQLAAAEEVPSGLLPLIDPDHQPAAAPDPVPGAIVALDDELFLPLPVNDCRAAPSSPADGCRRPASDSCAGGFTATCVSVTTTLPHQANSPAWRATCTDSRTVPPVGTPAGLSPAGRMGGQVAAARSRAGSQG